MIARLFLILVLVPCFFGCERMKEREIESHGHTTYQKVTGHGLESERKYWNQRFKSEEYLFGKDPAKILRTFSYLLPTKGLALDIAMSEGRNAVYLAERGLTVDGVDISEAALRKASLLAREKKVKINIINADLNFYKIKPNSYDLIINILFLQRDLFIQIKRGLRPGGIIVFENQTVDFLKKDGAKGMRREFLLEKGELRKAFSDFEIIHHAEFETEIDAVAQLIARKKK